MVRTFAEAVMGADADAVCGAGYEECTNSRNGYRDRPWDTRVGSIELRVPKLRTGSYFPDWLLGRRTRAEQALISVVATAYLLGVSTRRVEGLVNTLGIEKLSKSQVSDMAKHLDALVGIGRRLALAAVGRRALPVPVDRRPGGEGPRGRAHPEGQRDGRHGGQRRRPAGDPRGGRGHRGDRAGWLAFLRGLLARGLSGVELAISDAHGGLVDALAAALPGASWQRCRTHFAANLLAKVPKSAQPFVATLLRSIFDQPDAVQVHAQFDRVEQQLRERFPAVADYLADAGEDLLAFTAFPVEHADVDPEQQPAGTAEQGDPSAHRRRRDLPRPGQRDPPDRRGAGRAARRVVRWAPLPVRREPGQATHHVRREPRRPTRARHRDQAARAGPCCLTYTPTAVA